MKSLLKKKIDFIYLLLPIVFFSFWLIHNNVVYFGDDYYFLSFRDLNASNYFAKLGEHYTSDNGRLIVHFLATLFLKLPLPFWRILNSLFLTGICFFIARIIKSYANSYYKRNSTNTPSFSAQTECLIFCMLFFLLASLDIMISRQSVYWLTGSFNYVYPLFIFFGYWYAILHTKNKWQFVGTCILCILSSTSMEQSGMMTFGLTLLLLLSKIEKKSDLKTVWKTNFPLLFLCLLSFIGVCSVLFAPSQFIRIGISGDYSILNNLLFLVKSFLASNSILPYCFFFHLFAILYAWKNNCPLGVFFLAITNLLGTIINCHLITQTDVITPLNILLLTWNVICYAFIFFYLNHKIFHKVLSPLVITAILLIGSQIMMLVSPVFGPRNLIFGLALWGVIIGFLISAIKLSYSAVFSAILFTCALFLNFSTMKHYQGTKKIEEQNQIVLLTADKQKLMNPEEKITLYKFPNSNYAWSMPYISDFHEYWFKQFYHIECQIEWTEPILSEKPTIYSKNNLIK